MTQQGGQFTWRDEISEKSGRSARIVFCKEPNNRSLLSGRVKVFIKTRLDRAGSVNPEFTEFYTSTRTSKSILINRSVQFNVRNNLNNIFLLKFWNVMIFNSCDRNFSIKK